ncbi:MAG: hypothetical protein ABEK04_03610, partial [Candidatus Nanohalobium sp.]
MRKLKSKVLRMLKEEWRMQSKLFEGRNLAALPALIFGMTFLGVKVIQRYSETSLFGIGLMLSVFGLFSGLASASTGFSSRDASRNVLKNKTFLIYSSRTLPTSKNKLTAAFFIKNILFYLGLYLVPVGLGAVIAETSLIIYTVYMMALFLVGQLCGIFLAKKAISIPVRKFLNYYNLRGTSLTRKFFLDIYRSSGGLLKVFISVTALLGLYWYAANYVPLADYLLVKPMLSFAVILGLSSITIYNWLNTYDSVGDYTFLEIDEEQVLSEKFKAFKYISLGTVGLFLILFYLVQGGNLLLGLVLGGSLAYYTGAVSFYFAGLHPNENMVNTLKFTAFMVAVNIFVIPLLGYSSMNVNTDIFYPAS